ncbi:hypothetical protein ACFTTN_03030 [Streptomyces niveus]
MTADAQSGIIPARVGSTTFAGRERADRGDDPCERGKHLTL